MISKFIPANSEQQYIFPPSIEDWLSKVHQARFVIETDSQLNLRPAYANKGFKPYPPDNDTIATFRNRFLEQLKPLFTQILMFAHEMGLLKLGNVNLDGTKTKANAFKHHFLSWEHACKSEQQLQSEVNELTSLAEQTDSQKISDGMDIPGELHRSQDLLNAIAQAKATIDERAVQKYKEKAAARNVTAKASSKKLCGPEPKPPTSRLHKKDQVNLTDEESRIMASSDKGFVQAYNARASVDVDAMFTVESHLSQAPSDKLEIICPPLASLNELPSELGMVATILADAGYFCDNNAASCEQSRVEPFIPPNRDKHNQTITEQFVDSPPRSEDVKPIEKMRNRVKTVEGRNFYAKRKSTIELVFGIVKHAFGFRQFFFRGLEGVSV
jgi:hypothetical protein